MLDKAEKLKVSERCGPSSKCIWPVGCELPALKVKVKCAWKPSTDSPKHCHEIPLVSNLETFPTGQCHESTFLLGPVLRCSALIPTQGLHWPRNVTRPEGSTCLLIPPSYKKVIVPGLPASWGSHQKGARDSFVLACFQECRQDLPGKEKNNCAGGSLHQSPGTCSKVGWRG